MNYRRNFLTLLCIGFFAFGCSSSPTKEQLLKVTEFMDRDTVELIMGKPSNIRYSRVGSGEVIHWDYSVAGERWTITFGRNGTILGATGHFQTLQGTKAGSKDFPNWGKPSEEKPFKDFL